MWKNLGNGSKWKFKQPRNNNNNNKIIKKCKECLPFLSYLFIFCCCCCCSPSFCLVSFFLLSCSSGASFSTIRFWRRICYRSGFRFLLLNFDCFLAGSNRSGFDHFNLFWEVIHINIQTAENCVSRRWRVRVEGGGGGGGGRKRIKHNQING